jgi:hypothetical protein
MPGYLILLKRTTVESAATFCEAATKEEAKTKALAKVDEVALIWEAEPRGKGPAQVSAVDQVFPFKS